MRSSISFPAVFGLMLVVAPVRAPAADQMPKPTPITMVEGKDINEWRHDLSSPDPSVREQAIRAIALLTGPHSSEVINLLLDRCQDTKDVSVQVRAIQAITILEVRKDDQPRLIRVMSDRLMVDQETIVRFHAALCLQRFGPEGRDAVPALIKGATDRRSFETRRMCIRALESCGFLAVPAAPGAHPPPDPRVTKVLLDCLRDPTGAIKMEAVIALGGMGRSPDPAIQAQVESSLTSLAGSKDHNVSIWSLVSLMAIQQEGPKESWVKRLIDYTKGSEPQRVRLQAISALTIVGVRVKTVVPRLIELLDDKDTAVVAGACTALGTLQKGAEPALPALKKLADSTTDKAMKTLVEETIKYINAAK
jgi:HEAT repeat protein